MKRNNVKRLTKNRIQDADLVLVGIGREIACRPCDRFQESDHK